MPEEILCLSKAVEWVGEFEEGSREVPAPLVVEYDSLGISDVECTGFVLQQVVL